MVDKLAIKLADNPVDGYGTDMTTGPQPSSNNAAGELASVADRVAARIAARCHQR